MLFQKIKDQFASNIESLVKNNKKKIIFIVGMPRSGTTLAEQIISSHKNVYGAGELMFLSEMLLDKFSDKNKKIINFQNLQDDYLTNISLIDKSKKNITDKAPLNFRWIGFINVIFPNSKIIHCSRDMMDNCWSIYKNNFDAGLSFSFNLSDLGKYYNLYQNLMNFWHSKYPGKIYDLIYENLANNQETEVKKLLNFCELEWDSNCLKHHNNTKPIKTVSAVQARKPIYKTSMKSSDKYSEYLEELKTILKV